MERLIQFTEQNQNNKKGGIRMKTIIFSILFTMVGLSAYAAHPWAKFEGCYNTVERNGQSVVTPNDEVSKIEFGDAWIVKDTAGEMLPSMNFVIFQKYSAADDTSYYDYQAAFQDLGKYSQDQNGDHFAFAGQLMYIDGTVFSMTSTITVQERSASKLVVKSKRVVPNTDGSFDSDDEYILEKKSCN
jgi:hypothetical protein